MSTFSSQGSKPGAEESHPGGQSSSTPARPGSGQSSPSKQKMSDQSQTRPWQGHPPPGGGGGGGAGEGGGGGTRSSLPPAGKKSPSPGGGRVRKSPTPEPRTRKSPTPDRVRKSPTPTRQTPSPGPPRGSPRRGKPPSPRASPAKTVRARKTPSPTLESGTIRKEDNPTSTQNQNTQNDGAHFAVPTIIDDDDDHEDPPNPKEFNRSISEPPEELLRHHSVSGVAVSRKLSEGEGAGAGNLTGMFFTKLIQKEENNVHASNSSLASQDSGRGVHSRTNSVSRSGAPNKISSLTPNKRQGMRFSHGEDKAPGDVFDSNMIKKAASVAHVETFSKTVKTGTIKTEQQQERFRGKELVNMLSSGLSDDNYLQLSLTNKDTSFIARRFGAQLLNIGVLKSSDQHDGTIKVQH